MKKILLTLSLFVAGIGAAYSQSTIWKPYDIKVDTSWGIRYMSAVDTSTIWAVAFDGSNTTRTSNVFVRTKNGGQSFSKGMFLPDTNTYNAANISAVDTAIAYVACFEKAADGGSGVIRKTINGGLTWTNASDSLTMFTGASNFPDFVHFWDANNGLALGDPNGNTSGSGTEFELWRTNNGGTTWTRVADANLPNPLSGEYGLTNCYTTYGSHMWFGTNKARVYASADSGKTWTVNATVIAGLAGQVEGVAFRNSLNGLAWGQSTTSATTTVYNLAKTSDGGATWLAIPTATTNVSIGTNDICAVPGANSFMSVGINKAKSAYVTSITGDDGTTWNILESGQTNAVRMLQVQMLDTLNGWAGCFSDTTHPLGKNGMDRYMGAKIAQACPISIAASKTSVCAGDSSILTASGATTYTWTTIGANTSTVTVKPTTGVTYTVSGSTGTCSSVQTISVSVKATPTITVNQHDTICVNGSVAISASGATTYSWSPSTGLSATTGANVTASPSVNTVYTLAGTKNTCTKLTTVNVIINQNCYAGIEQVINASNISIYPNPSKGLVTVVMSAVNAGTTLYVTDMIGKEVFKTVVIDTNTNLDLSNLEKGLYMVTVANGQNKHIQKLIIQ